MRFATFNVSFSGGKAGQITQRLATGEGKDFERIALIIQTVRPDVVVINEFDF